MPAGAVRILDITIKVHLTLSRRKQAAVGEFSFRFSASFPGIVSRLLLVRIMFHKGI
jgi:hypothetical protein